jgi:hypothetical protein
MPKSSLVAPQLLNDTNSFHYIKMYDLWFLDQDNYSNDFFHADFETFGIQKQDATERLSSARRLSSSELISWLMIPNSVGSMKLL